MTHIKMSVLLKLIYRFNIILKDTKMIICAIRLDGSKVHVDKQIGKIANKH